MTDYPELNLPSFNIRLKEEQNEVRVFDPLREKWILLTPEEWVRQHFINWLKTEFHYPLSLMANEVKINLNDTVKRCDTVIFRRDGSPFIIVEYKAPNVAVTQNVFDQIARYNMQLHADYLIVSNGLNHYCCKLDYANNTYHFIPHIPDYGTIAAGASEN